MGILSPGKKRVLIIEDDFDICRTLELAFTNDGFAVTTARDGMDGLKKAREGKHSLIILDLMLPGLPGEEICRELRKDERHNIPIIMLTAKDTDTDKVIGKVIGADSYVAKPFDLDKLLTEANKLIRR